MLDAGVPHPHSLLPLSLPAEQEEVDHNPGSPPSVWLNLAARRTTALPVPQEEVGRNPGSPQSVWVKMAARRTTALPGSRTRTRLVRMTTSSCCHGAHVGEK